MTWSAEERFKEPLLKYTKECATRSQLDFDQYRVQPNHALDIASVKCRSNSVLFDREREILVKEQEIVEADRKMKAKDFKRKVDNEQARKVAERSNKFGSSNMKDKPMFWKITFKYEDHRTVKLMKPLVSQVITDIKKGAKAMAKE